MLFPRTENSQRKKKKWTIGCAEDMLKPEVIEEKKFNQRPMGHNAHLSEQL